jgi:hypothetical protein
VLSISSQTGWRICASLSGLAVVGVIGLGIASHSADPFSESRVSAAESQHLESNTHLAPVVRRPQPSQWRSFAPFRTRPESLPRPVIEKLRQTKYGLNGILAQRLLVDTPEKMWVVPGNGFICIVGYQVRQSTALVCDTTKDARNHGVTMTRLGVANAAAPRPKRIIVGIAPDQAHKVHIHTGSTVVSASVTGNVFLRRDSVSAPPDRVTFP